MKLMKKRAILLLIVTVAVVSVGCEQLADLQNNNSRIKGEWKMFDRGFPSDNTYVFSSGIIKENDFAWGTYKFTRRDTIDVALGDKAGLYQVEFKSDTEMVWFEMRDGRRYDVYSWRR